MEALGENLRLQYRHGFGDTLPRIFERCGFVSDIDGAVLADRSRQRIRCGLPAAPAGVSMDFRLLTSPLALPGWNQPFVIEATRAIAPGQQLLCRYLEPHRLRKRPGA